MSGKIRIGIVGYGNLGKGAVKAIQQTEDMELVAVFTRRIRKIYILKIQMRKLNIFQKL